MNILFGKNLKALRLKKGLTQEQLAELFSVSPQAVSRWENGSAYPDMTMLPGIAVYFDVSVDTLLGMENIRKKDSLNRIFTIVHEHEAKGELDEAIALLRDSIKTHPDDDGLLCELALVLTRKQASSPSDPMIVEAISLSEKILKHSTNTKIRSTVTANLCFLYIKAGKSEQAEKLARTLPHVWESREILLPEIKDDGLYQTELKKSVALILSLLAQKIQLSSSRRRGVPDGIIALGISRESAEEWQNHLDRIREFMLADESSAK